MNVSPASSALVTASSESGQLLEVSGLTVVHRTPEGDNSILTDISVSLQKGESIALVGESGSGKSMLSKAIVGLLPPGVVMTAGSLRYNGVELSALSSRQRAEYRGGKMTLLFQDPFTTLNPLLRTGDHIVEGLELSAGTRMSRPEGRKEAIRRLAEVQITDERVVDRYPFQLSGGMRQRVALAAALARDPDLLIADEPSTALDVTTQAEILQLIKDTQKARQMGLIFISHDLRVAFSVCDRVYVLYGGSIMETGPTAKLFAEPQHPYTHGLMLSEPTARGRQADLYSIEGSVPRPDHVKDRCSFADRCRWARPECTAAKPPLAKLADAVQTRCIRITAIRDEMHLERHAVKAMTDPAAVPEAAPVIASVRDLQKVFDVGRGQTVAALRGVSFDIRKGESIGLVGESGSGKTTAARCLVGLESASGGTIQLFPGGGTEAIGPSERRARGFVQIVFQDPYSSLNPRQSVGSALMEPLRLMGRDKTAARREAEELLDTVGLPAAYLSRRPDALSGGERQRVAIARALSVKPELLVCDEPVSALDVSVQAQVLKLFRNLRERFGVSLLFITHDMAVVRQVADSVHILYQGKVVESGPVGRVLDNPQDDYTIRLIASIPGESHGVAG